MSVANTFADWALVGEPYERGGVKYQAIERDGRQHEAIYFPDGKEPKPPFTHPIPIASIKSTFGFYPHGYIYILKGAVDILRDWIAADSRFVWNGRWGWGFPCQYELPTLPAGLEAVKLQWSDVADDETDTLKSEGQIKDAVAKLVYGPSKSAHIGSIGERIEVQVTLRQVVELEEGFYGSKRLYVFVDGDGNEYTWNTSTTKPWECGDEMLIRGTVSGHSTYKGSDQTNLQRVMKRS